MNDGRLGRLVNDSKNKPNCRMKKVLINGKLHLCLFAIRNIAPREELLYDYGTTDLWWRIVSTWHWLVICYFPNVNELTFVCCHNAEASQRQGLHNISKIYPRFCLLPLPLNCSYKCTGNCAKLCLLSLLRLKLTCSIVIWAQNYISCTCKLQRQFAECSKGVNCSWQWQKLPYILGYKSHFRYRDFSPKTGLRLIHEIRQILKFSSGPGRDLAS